MLLLSGLGENRGRGGWEGTGLLEKTPVVLQSCIYCKRIAAYLQIKEPFTEKKGIQGGQKDSC